MKKRGFTLIELLAVILVLGIIALIAIPVVNSIIDESKKGSFKTTMQNVVNAIESDCQVQRLKGKEITTTYTFSNKGVSPSISIKGKLPTSGIISVNNECNVSFSNVTDGKYTATKEIDGDITIIVAELSSKVCRVTQGDGTNIGDVITCKTESFYVYDTTGDSIKMLAKYNLKVGGEYSLSNYSYTPYEESEMTYMQDENMRGFTMSQGAAYGTTVYSSSSQKGENYSSYEGSIVQGYVNKYKEILTEMGITVEEARLITKEELEQLVNNGNSLSREDIKNKADALKRSWIYSTSYWTGSFYSTDAVWYIYSLGNFYFNDFDFNMNSGVRPVVKILKTEI